MSDGFALIEAPDDTTAGGVAIASPRSARSGSSETHVLMTQAELLEALEKAGEVAYAAPGAAVPA